MIGYLLLQMKTFRLLRVQGAPETTHGFWK